MKVRWITGIVVALLVLGGAAPAAAQSGEGYDLEWSTVDDGGKYSAGEGYWLGGAVGQPDAGTMSGEDFELNGGFWRIKGEHPSAVDLIELAGRPQAAPWAALAVLAAAAASLAAMRSRSPRSRKTSILSRKMIKWS
jgi:hypothetical protein